MKKLIAIAALSILSVSQIAHAEETRMTVTVGSYKKFKTSSAMEAYLSGVIEGYVIANAELEMERKSRPFFCTPENLTLNAENAFDLIDNYLAKNNHIQDTYSISFPLLLALEEAFPCKWKQGHKTEGKK